MKISEQAVKLDCPETKNVEAIIEDIARKDPQYRRIATELLKVRHYWAQIDMIHGEPKLRYILIPADASKFKNPGEGVNWYALDDDLLKIEGVDPIQFLFKSDWDIKTKAFFEEGFKGEMSGISILNGTDILPIDFYDMIGSQEKIKWGEDRQSYALLLRRSATGMTRRNRLCLGLLVNNQRFGREDFKLESELFGITDFDPQSSCDDAALFPATLISGKFGVIQVINIRSCLQQYEPEFKKKFPLARGYYPYFDKPAQ